MSQVILHTIGYEGSSIEDFLTTVNSVGINLLIDVRDVPISRKAGFSKSSLATHLSGRGIKYLHLKGLGDPKEGRIAAREGRYSEFRNIFKNHLTSSIAQIDMQRAITDAQEHIACLMCFERDHSQCHRCIVAEEMARRGEFKLVHLGVRKSTVVRERVVGGKNYYGDAASV